MPLHGDSLTLQSYRPGWAKFNANFTLFEFVVDTEGFCKVSFYIHLVKQQLANGCNHMSWSVYYSCHILKSIKAFSLN